LLENVGIGLGVALGGPEVLARPSIADGRRIIGSLKETDVTLQIDDATANRLYGKCKSDLKFAKGRTKESPVTEQCKLAALGVPCVVDFGFVVKNVASQSQIHACVWIFSECSPDFFGSFYLPVDEDAFVPEILNSAIANAIKNAKASQKFQDLQATIASRNIWTVQKSR